jgi:predicted RNA-binding Zn ribbon-like protein
MAAAGLRPFELIGGHVAVDLVNTVSWRLDGQRKIDRAPGYQELLAWARQAQLVAPAQYQMLREAIDHHPVRGRQAASAVHRLREALYRVLGPVAIGEEPAPGDRSALHHLIVQALQQARLVTVFPLVWQLTVHAPGDLAHLLALRALDLLQSGDLGRLRQCQDHACGWLFIDRSRSHTRRWCSSADCGNRERARRHYTRRHNPGGTVASAPDPPC